MKQKLQKTQKDLLDAKKAIEVIRLKVSILKAKVRNDRVSKDYICELLEELEYLL